MSAFLLAAGSLARREIVRFFRQRNRIVGALATPVVFWLFLGFGLGGSFRADGESYLRYLFPGTLVMILLFAAIFATISIIEDRREGFLQGVLVAPVSRGTIVAGKIAGGTAVAVIQAALFLALAPAAGVALRPAAIPYLLGVMTLLAFGLTGLGFLIAWRMDSTQGFHAIMNLFLMPMWFLSGALFLPERVQPWLHAVILLNPLTYGVTAVRYGFGPGGPMPLRALAVTAGFALAMWALAARAARRDSGGAA